MKQHQQQFLFLYVLFVCVSFAMLRSFRGVATGDRRILLSASGFGTPLGSVVDLRSVSRTVWW